MFDADGARCAVKEPMKPKIEVAADQPGTYAVIVSEGGSKTTHVVRVTPAEHAKYAPDATPEALVRASFEFLLERESKESILRQFSLSTIESYFPDYPKQIRSRL
jgi:hypothetical protein